MFQTLRTGATVTAEVDYNRRARIAPNHSMTHVMHWALQDVLHRSISHSNNNNHHVSMKIEQRGSLVSDEKLRFDFSAPRAMTLDEIQQVETHVNDVIR